MRISFEILKSMIVFAHVANQQGFNKAAKILAISPASVSYHIKKLEKKLGVNLINRTTRRFSLTSSGTTYYQSCLKLYQEAEAANLLINKIKKEPTGTLNVFSSIILGRILLLPLLEIFNQTYPKITLAINLTDQEPNIFKDKIDIAISHLPINKNQDVFIKKLSTLQQSIYGSPEYFNKHGRPQNIEDLNHHCWIKHQEISGKDTKPVIRTNSFITKLYFVERHYGIAMLPDILVASRVKAGILEKVTFENQETVSSKIYAIYSKGDKDTLKNKLFINFLVKNFKLQIEKQKSNEEILYF